MLEIPIQNNLNYNIPNIQGKYIRMVIPFVKWVQCIQTIIVLLDLAWNGFR